MINKLWLLGLCSLPLSALPGCSDEAADRGTASGSEEAKDVASGGARNDPLGRDSAGGGDPSAEPTSRAWETLLTGDWTLPAGTEDYVCVRQTMTEDVYVRAFNAVNPPGTHHTFLTMGPASGPDGITPCEATENHEQMVFGSGVGTNPIEYPEGVAVKVNAGSQLLLNLHLFNTTTEEVSGTSAVEIEPVEASDVDYIGQSLTAGAFEVNVPPRQESSLTGYCIIEGNSTLFGVVPHMHELGIHMKVVAESSIDGERVLHDAPYDFDQQLYYPIEPFEVAEGDRVQFECRWRNDTDRDVTFGDSTLDEMCFVALYRYPAGESSFCTGM